MKILLKAVTVLSFSWLGSASSSAQEFVAYGRGGAFDYLELRVSGHSLCRVNLGGAPGWFCSGITDVAPPYSNLVLEFSEEGGRLRLLLELQLEGGEIDRDIPIKATTSDVIKGVSMWRMAEAYWGDGTFYNEIAELNSDQVKNPDVIYPGQIIILPVIDENIYFVLK